MSIHFGDPETPRRRCPAECAVSQYYVQACSARHGRSGTLRQGRFKSSLVDSERYLLTVVRYIELNPVRAAMVATPEEYRWSCIRTSAKLATH